MSDLSPACALKRTQLAQTIVGSIIAVSIGGLLSDNVIGLTLGHGRSLLHGVAPQMGGGAIRAAISPSSFAIARNASFQRRSSSPATSRFTGPTASYCRRACAAS